MSVDIDALERQLDGMIRKIDAELGKAKHRVVVEHDDGAGNGFGDGDSNPSLDASEADDYNGEANGDLEDEEDDGEDEDDIGKASVDAFLRTHDESNRPGALAFSKHPPNRHKFEALTDKIKNEEGVPKSQALALARMRFPDVFESYQQHTAGTNIGKSAPVTFEDLVAAEMRKGVNAEVAGQRVLQAHGSHALRHRALSKRSLSAELAEDELVKRADDIWEDDATCSRTDALRKARRANPKLFKALQTT